MKMKELASYIVPRPVWNWLRSVSIVRRHAAIASICEDLIENTPTRTVGSFAKKSLGTERIIWQYWAQGFDSAPGIVKECISSIDGIASDYHVIRLDDKCITEYLDIPDFIIKRKAKFSSAHYSDLLRLLILTSYGGVWLDATVKLSSSLPEKYYQMDFFMFQRDSQEREKQYWENAYAYYFGWRKGFRVNVLNSVIFSRKGSSVINRLTQLMLEWWRRNDAIPDYFFFQILFDVLMKGELKELNCPVESDCKPHYLQQLINDPSFSLMTRDEILRTIPIHKLTYK